MFAMISTSARSSRAAIHLVVFFLQWIINMDTGEKAKSLVHIGVCGVKPRFP